MSVVLLARQEHSGDIILHPESSEIGNEITSSENVDLRVELAGLAEGDLKQLIVDLSHSYAD